MKKLNLENLTTDRMSGQIGDTDSAAAATKAATATHTKGQQVEASPAEQAERKSAMRTQGRKGCKAERIHTAYSPENYQYIKSIAAANGVTLTKVVNAIIDEHRALHPEVERNMKRAARGIQKAGLNLADKK